jgi:SEC-C motif-containing protein
MRSRFSGFALGLGAYLVRTLASEHPDAALPAEALARELGQAHQKQRFQGLSILLSDETESGGEVLFVARVFERGVDRSFAELSRFVREGGGWRYASGDLVPASLLPADLAGLDRAAFRALARKSTR